MTDKQPLLILGSERREVHDPMMTGYCWALFVGALLCTLAAVVVGFHTPLDQTAELNSTEPRTMPEHVDTTEEQD